MHYKRAKRSGALPEASAFGRPSEDRFFDLVTPTGFCWEWGGGLMGGDYGTFDNRAAHRFAYEFLVGPIPDGLHLDHLCRVRHCVNPDHLEPVTVEENNRRSRATRSKGVTHVG
jgi:hypothetical protein